jgi:predicted  nucleic acid-binding Zn-ribbon protein
MTVSLCACDNLSSLIPSLNPPAPFDERFGTLSETLEHLRCYPPDTFTVRVSLEYICEFLLPMEPEQHEQRLVKFNEFYETEKMRIHVDGLLDKVTQLKGEKREAEGKIKDLRASIDAFLAQSQLERAQTEETINELRYSIDELKLKSEENLGELKDQGHESDETIGELKFNCDKLAEDVARKDCQLIKAKRDSKHELELIRPLAVVGLWENFRISHHIPESYKRQRSNTQ